VIPTDTWAEIRRLFFVDHQSINAIAEALGVHHKTVARAIGTERFRSKLNAEREAALAQYDPVIMDVLSRLPKIRATRLIDMLRDRGYTGSIDQLRRYLRRVRPAPANRVFAKLCFVAGEQAQCDWASCGKLPIGKAQRSLSLFVMVLSYSRFIYARFTLDQTFESFAREHIRAFSTFSGVPRIVLYDNLKAAVIERFGNAISYSPQLSEIAGYYHFRIQAAAVRAPQSKGRVERAIGYLKTAFLPGRIFRDLEDANTQLQHWLTETANKRPWPQERDRSVDEAFREEQSHLLKLPEHPLEFWYTKTTRAVRWPRVCFEGNDYEIPTAYLGKTLTLNVSDEIVRLLDGAQEICRHPRCYDKGKTIALPEESDGAHPSAQSHIARRKEHLLAVIPEAEALCQMLIDMNEPLRGHLGRLYELIQQFGRPRVREAIIRAIANQTPRSESVAQLLQNHAPAQPQIPLQLPDRKNIKDLIVRSHDLSGYDDLYTIKE
jgi:transposase